MFTHFHSNRIMNAQTLQAPTTWAAAALLWPFCRMAFVSASHMAELVAHSLVSPGTAASTISTRMHTSLLGVMRAYRSLHDHQGGAGLAVPQQQLQAAMAVKVGLQPLSHATFNAVLHVLQLLRAEQGDAAVTR